MIELVEQRLKCGLDIGKIHHPTRVLIRLALHVDGNAERMAMQTTAFMRSRKIRQPVRGFDLKFLENFHRAILIALDVARRINPVNAV